VDGHHLPTKCKRTRVGSRVAYKKNCFDSRLDRDEDYSLLLKMELLSVMLWMVVDFCVEKFLVYSFAEYTNAM